MTSVFSTICELKNYVPDFISSGRRCHKSFCLKMNHLWDRYPKKTEHFKPVASEIPEIQVAIAAYRKNSVLIVN